jgi:hypothetical protein
MDGQGRRPSLSLTSLCLTPFQNTVIYAGLDHHDFVALEDRKGIGRLQQISPIGKIPL